MGRSRAKKPDPGKILAEILRQRGRVRIPQLVDLSAAFIDSIGGVRHFATELATQYKAAPAGGMARTKILEMVLKGLRGSEGEKPDLQRLSEAELKQFLAAQIAEYMTLAEADDGEAEADPGQATPPAGEGGPGDVLPGDAGHPAGPPPAAGVRGGPEPDPGPGPPVG